MGMFGDAIRIQELEKEIKRLREALTDIAYTADEDNEWEGRDKFHEVREIAHKAISG